ncbi:unnamed protein product [Urochloa humidicola]
MRRPQKYGRNLRSSTRRPRTQGTASVWHKGDHRRGKMEMGEPAAIAAGRLRGHHGVTDLGCMAKMPSPPWLALAVESDRAASSFSCDVATGEGKERQSVTQASLLHMLPAASGSSPRAVGGPPPAATHGRRTVAEGPTPLPLPLPAGARRAATLARSGGRGRWEECRRSAESGASSGAEAPEKRL